LFDATVEDIDGTTVVLDEPTSTVLL